MLRRHGQSRSFPWPRLALESTADCGHVHTERRENPAGASLGVGERRQQKSVHAERVLPSRDRPLRRLAKRAAQTRLRFAEAQRLLASGRERAHAGANPPKRGAFTGKRLRRIAVTAQHGNQHMLTSERSRLHRQCLLAREPKHMTRRLGRRHPWSAVLREISITTMRGLARDPEGPSHLAKGSAGGEPALDLLAVEQLDLTTQLGQRLERAQGIVRIAGLLSQAANSLSPRSHSVPDPESRRQKRKSVAAAPQLQLGMPARSARRADRHTHNRVVRCRWLRGELLERGDRPAQDP